jgi:hypothetical protein
MTAIQEQTIAKFEVRKIDVPSNLPAVSEWVRNIEDKMAKAVGIPAELMRPKEPEHKQSIMAKFFGKFKGV